LSEAIRQIFTKKSWTFGWTHTIPVVNARHCDRGRRSWNPSAEFNWFFFVLVFLCCLFVPFFKAQHINN
jgi:hypothetical protein